jgi:hypothetical protein
VRGKDQAELSDTLSRKYKGVANNKLKVNDEKTTRQKRRFVNTNNVQIETPTAIIKPSNVERLLGAQNIRWVEHILDSDQSLVKSLNLRVGALSKISKLTSFKTRKTIASGIFMSKLIYLMPLWSGCEDYLVKCLQVVQNKAARTVAKRNIFKPTRTLMKVCGLMSVRQLLAYQSLVLLPKTLVSQTAVYLYKKLTVESDFSYKTRQPATFPPGFSFTVTHPTDSGAVRLESGTKKGISKQGWCWKSVQMKRLKEWIWMNVAL